MGFSDELQLNYLHKSMQLHREKTFRADIMPRYVEFRLH